MPRTAPFSAHDARVAISRSSSWADALRFLGYVPKGGNYRTLQRWARIWGISTSHFDPNIGRVAAAAKRQRPLEEVLVASSTYPRGHLKRRLIAAGLKQPVCERC